MWWVGSLLNWRFPGVSKPIKTISLSCLPARLSCYILMLLNMRIVIKLSIYFVSAVRQNKYMESHSIFLTQTTKASVNIIKQVWKQNRKTLIRPLFYLVLVQPWVKFLDDDFTATDYRLTVLVDNLSAGAGCVIWSRQWQRLLITDRLWITTKDIRNNQDPWLPCNLSVSHSVIATQHLSPLICCYNSSLETSFCWDC